jgi:hypothetical protein
LNWIVLKWDGVGGPRRSLWPTSSHPATKSTIIYRVPM